MSSPGGPFTLSIDASGIGSAAVVRVTGELDVATAPELDACLLALDGDDIMIDMAGLTFMDSSGISVLLTAFKRSTKGGHRFVLRGPTPPVVRVLHVSGVDQVFTIEA
jgi:anti-anti-sigma factor